MIKLSKAEALNYLEKGYVVIIRNKDFEDYPVIKQGEYLCRYDDPIEGELINEMLQENDEFYYDKVLDEEYYQKVAWFMKSNDKKQITLCISKDLYSQLKSEAERRGIPNAIMVNIILSDYLEANCSVSKNLPE